MRKEKLRKVRLCFIKGCFIKPFQIIINRFFYFSSSFTAQFLLFDIKNIKRGWQIKHLFEKQFQSFSNKRNTINTARFLKYVRPFFNIMK